MKVFLQSILLIISFGFVYLWQNTPLSQYTIPVLGFFIFLYLIISFRKKRLTAPTFSGNELVTIFTLNTVIFLLIFSTGAMTSPLFFLLYFVAFGIAFVFEPFTVFIFAVGTILILLPNAILNDSMKNLLVLGSLGLISPLAFFFGREFKREEKQEEKLKTIEKEAKELLQDKDLNSIEKEKINKIVEEAEK